MNDSKPKQQLARHTSTPGDAGWSPPPPRQPRTTRHVGRVQSIKRQGDGALRMTVIIESPIPPEATAKDRLRLEFRQKADRLRQSKLVGQHVAVELPAVED